MFTSHLYNNVRSYLYDTNIENVRVDVYFNLLKPTGYVVHHQFNIQQLYALPTLYLCVLYLSENSDLCHLHLKLISFHN
jgi:hypothetical protein